MFDKIKSFFKENWLFICIMFLIVILFNIHLPFYINAPGGVININDRIDCSLCNDINGELNMLYVSEYEATIPTFLLSYIFSNWDVEKIEEYQVNDESVEEIYQRNRVMLNNSINNAIYVAYKEAGKKVEIKENKMTVIATTVDNGLKIGDVILKVDDKDVKDVAAVKKIINSYDVSDKINFEIKRGSEIKSLNLEVTESDDNKVIGVVISNNYSLEMDPEIKIKFKKSEAGSSGGLMMALSMYDSVNDYDIIRGRKIAGTGTIDFDGSVGKIDGIKYKIMGAAKNKIDIVFVPKENYKEAIEVKKKNNYDLDIVSVDNFSDAIEYLKKL